MEELTKRKNEMLKGEQGSREERGVEGWVGEGGGGAECWWVSLTTTTLH